MDFLKLPEVARRLGISERTARRYVKSGILPSRFIGGAYRVSPEDLEAFLERTRVRAMEEGLPSPFAPAAPLDEVTAYLLRRCGESPITDERLREKIDAMGRERNIVGLSELYQMFTCNISVMRTDKHDVSPELRRAFKIALRGARTRRALIREVLDRALDKVLSEEINDVEELEANA